MTEQEAEYKSMLPGVAMVNQAVSFRLSGEPLYMLVPEYLAGRHFVVKLENFPRFCGAGNGFGEKVVPDSILGINLRPACFFHDLGFTFGRTWADFHYVNSAFRHNMNVLIDAQGKYRVQRWLTRHIALDYYHTVETAGAVVFSRIMERGMPKSAIIAAVEMIKDVYGYGVGSFLSQEWGLKGGDTDVI